jgi:apolipoprotein N-acyltransferase
VSSRRRIPPGEWAALAGACAAGLVSYAAFKPAGWWFLAPVAIGALYAATLRLRAGGVWLAGLGFALGQFLPLLTWAYNAAGLLPYLALAVASALLLSVGPLAYAWGRPVTDRLGGGRGRWLDAAAFAVAVSAADSVRSYVPFGGFPWGRIGFSQAPGPMADWAFVGGVPLVGLAAALVGTLAVAAGLSLGRRRALAAAGAAVAVTALIACPMAFPLPTAPQAGTLRVGAVQGDVHVTAEGLFARQREVLENHVAETMALVEREGAGTLDVVLWPENSTDIDPRTDAEAWDSIDAAAAAARAPILVGAMEYLPTKQRYNQGLLWEAGKGVVGQYAKQHPAPFAEYMPARSFFRIFTSKVDLISTDMLAGDRIGILDLDAPVLGRTVALGDVICFEVAYDSIVAQTVREGAEVLVVQTNNASFGQSEESTQQFAMTRLRAIELGRAALQISTVGVSAAVAPDGSLMTAPTGLFEPASFAVDLPLRTSLTPAALIGGWIVWAIMLLGAALPVAGLGARLAARTPVSAKRPRR